MGKTAAMAAYAYPGAVPYSDPTAVQGRRIGAFFIDAAIVIVLAIITFLPLHSEESRAQAIREGKCRPNEITFGDNSNSTTCDGFTFESNGTVYFADPAWFWVNLGFSFAYFAVLQGVMGATAGKLMVGLRVVRPDGSIANIGWSSLRWLLFFVDGPLTLGICGLVTFLVSKGHRRVGDMVAGTYVVGTRSVGQPVVLPAPQVPVYAPTGYYPPPGQGYGPPPGQGYGPPPGQGYGPPPGQGYGPPPGQAYPPPPGQGYPPPGQAGEAPAPGAPSAPPTPTGVPAGPHWDSVRGTYVQADPETGVWHSWNTRTSKWEPLQ
jgi:uncharacterized RDD family membrane protein YckC